MGLIFEYQHLALEPGSNLAKEAEIMPLPNDDVTPPVTKIYFGLFIRIEYYFRTQIYKILKYNVIY